MQLLRKPEFLREITHFSSWIFLFIIGNLWKFNVGGLLHGSLNLTHIISVRLGTVKTFLWYMLCCIMQILQMLTHHGQYSSSREMAVWAGCWQWVGKFWEDLEGSFRNNTHVQVKRMKTHACVGSILSWNSWALFSEVQEILWVWQNYQFVNDGQDPSVRLSRKCSSPSPAQSSLPVNITSAMAGMSQPGCLFS